MPRSRAQAGPDGLTDKQRAFVEHYVSCWNGTEAARRAGYSARTANEQASVLLAKDSIQAVVKARIAELRMTADEVLLRLAEQARADLAEFIDVHGNLDLAGARKRKKLHLVKSYTSGKNGDRIELYSAQEALVHIGRGLGLWLDKVAPVDPTGEKEYGAGFTDDARIERLAQLLDAARARRDRRASASGAEGNPASSAPDAAPDA